MFETRMLTLSCIRSQPRVMMYICHKYWIDSYDNEKKSTDNIKT